MNAIYNASEITFLVKTIENSHHINKSTEIIREIKSFTKYSANTVILINNTFSRSCFCKKCIWLPCNHHGPCCFWVFCKRGISSSMPLKDISNTLLVHNEGFFCIFWRNSQSYPKIHFHISICYQLFTINNYLIDL